MKLIALLVALLVASSAVDAAQCGCIKRIDRLKARITALENQSGGGLEQRVAVLEAYKPPSSSTTYNARVDSIGQSHLTVSWDPGFNYDGSPQEYRAVLMSEGLVPSECYEEIITTETNATFSCVLDFNKEYTLNIFSNNPANPENVGLYRKRNGGYDVNVEDPSPPTPPTNPTTPANLACSNLALGFIELTWELSIDHNGHYVMYYDVYDDGALITRTSSTKYVHGRSPPSTTFNYTIVAVDHYNDLYSDPSETVTCTTWPQ